MRSRTLPVLLLALASPLLPGPGAAAIFKCIDASGAVTYTGRPCPEEDRSARVIDTDGAAGRPARRDARRAEADSRYRDADAAIEEGPPAAAEPLEPPPEREPPPRS